MSMDQENTSQKPRTSTHYFSCYLKVNSDHSYLNQSASCLLLQIDLGYRSNPSIVLVTSHKRLQLLLYYYSWHLFLLLQTTPQSPLASYSLHVFVEHSKLPYLYSHRRQTVYLVLIFAFALLLTFT
ncbi:hypothetical protein MJO29_011853 [Puccinia striiformis f. sp. tritici]|nr:hypothetical protein MJO29_011853 [Puccinia striiformis f. sp. tritici]